MTQISTRHAANLSRSPSCPASTSNLQPFQKSAIWTTNFRHTSHANVTRMMLAREVVPARFQPTVTVTLTFNMTLTLVYVVLRRR